MKKIDYQRLVELDKRRAWFAGRIHTYNQIIKHHMNDMSIEFIAIL